MNRRALVFFFISSDQYITASIGVMCSNNECNVLMNKRAGEAYKCGAFTGKVC